MIQCLPQGCATYGDAQGGPAGPKTGVSESETLSPSLPGIGTPNATPPTSTAAKNLTTG